MNRPKLTLVEAQRLIERAPDIITRSINDLVVKARIGQMEAAEYLGPGGATKAIIRPVMVLAIRGYYMNTMGKPGTNDRGIFDDCFALIGPNYYKTFNGNCDPSKEKPGIATLLPGWHEFRPGLHNYKNPYEAFRTANAAEVTPVLRDGKNGIQQGHTINLHAAGEFNTNSAGCQTVFKPQWKEFKEDAYRILKEMNQKTLPYLLLEQRFF